MKTNFTAILAICLLGATGLRAATTYYVSPYGDDSAAGTSWSGALTTIQAAVNKAAAGDTVVVTNGTYSLGGIVTTNGTYQLNNRVYITKDITVKSVNGPNVTIIKGVGSYDTQARTGYSRCVYMNQGYLDGFTLESGCTYAYGLWPNISCGGGLYFDATVLAASALNNTVRVQRCIFKNNTGHIGGGLYTHHNVNGQLPVIANCVFDSNTSVAAYGGGANTIRAFNCYFVNNRYSNLNVSSGVSSVDTDGEYNMAANCVFDPSTAQGINGRVYVYNSIIASTVTATYDKGGNKVNAPNLNTTTYRPAPNSPCINSGTRTMTGGSHVFPSALTNDFASYGRTNGVIDMGPVEWWLYPTENLNTVGTTDDIKLTWSSVIDADGYYVHRSLTDSFTSSTRLTPSPLPTTSSSYTDSTVVVGVTNYYWLVATNRTVENATTYSIAGPKGGYRVPLLTLSETQHNFPMAGGSASFTVTSNMAWRVRTTETFIHITQTANGVNYTVDATELSSARSGLIIVSTIDNSLAVTNTITQDGGAQVAQPVSSPPSGYRFKNSQAIRLTCATANADIFYTTDGSLPDTSDYSTPPWYLNTPFTITRSTTVKAQATMQGMLPSTVLTANFYRLYEFTATHSGGTTNGWYTDGENITLEATNRVGYVFTEWTGWTNTVDNPVEFAMPEEDVAVVGNYLPITPTGLSPSDGATVSPYAILSVTPEEGIEHVRWTVNGTTYTTSGDNMFTTNLTALLPRGHSYEWFVEFGIGTEWSKHSATNTFFFASISQLFVSLKGNGADGLTWATAYTNIQDAVDHALAGYTILVTNGVYDVGAHAVAGDVLPSRVVINKAITLTSVNGAGFTEIRGEGTYRNNPTAVRCINATTNAIIEGFTLAQGVTRYFNGSITDPQYYGAALLASNPANTTNILRRCIVLGNTGQGGTITEGGPGTLLVDNCLLYDNKGGAVIYIHNQGTIRLANCTIVDQTVSGNNLYNVSFNGNFRTDNSLFVSNTPSAFSGAVNSCVTTNASYFLDYAGGDFRLSEIAIACIDKGNNSWVASSYDLDGNDRIFNNTVDIGAYESTTKLNAAGIPYDWIDQYYDDVTDYDAISNEDTDGDGMTTYEEYISGTNPTDPNDRLLATIEMINEAPIIGWMPDLGAERRYQVIGKQNLPDPQWGVTNANSHFFKVKVSLP